MPRKQKKPDPYIHVDGKRLVIVASPYAPPAGELEGLGALREDLTGQIVITFKTAAQARRFNQELAWEMKHGAESLADGVKFLTV